MENKINSTPKGGVRIVIKNTPMDMKRTVENIAKKKGETVSSLGRALWRKFISEHGPEYTEYNEWRNENA